MLQVTRVQSEVFNSNVYVVRHAEKKDVILIDSGAYEDVAKLLQSGQFVTHVFLTHYHYDHIYYLEKWLELFPDAIVLGSEITFEGLLNAKKNLSFYQEDPIQVKNLLRIKSLKDGTTEVLLDQFQICAIETSGHCEGSLTYMLGDYIFTGDALIPNIPTVTKLKTGSKLQAMESHKKIRAYCNETSIICPGHLDMISSIDVHWQKYLD